MLVPNVEDINELTQHIRVLLYISAGVATALFILVIIGKTCSVVGERSGGACGGCWDWLAYTAATHCRALGASRKSLVTLCVVCKAMSCQRA